MTNTRAELALFGVFLSHRAPQLRTHSPLAACHPPLATCHPPCPTPSSSTRKRDRFACVTCYNLLRFPGFWKLWRPSCFSRRLLMGNDLDRNWHDLASPPRSWRNSKRTKAFWCHCHRAHALQKRLKPATFCYISATLAATYRLHVDYITAGWASHFLASGNEAGPRSLS